MQPKLKSDTVIFLTILQEVLAMAHSELYKGDANEDVTLLQKMLGINADGIFGDQTEAAVIKFQTAHGLGADGIVGAQTWSALEAAAKKASAPAPAATSAFGDLSSGFGASLGEQA
jgi:peptidoglycan hydrolase-like protein with peptidoglycan-binding domain